MLQLFFEPVNSLHSSFTAAGSRSTITSTWAARDESTHDILGCFFEELEAGAPKDIALQRAIKEYLAAGTAADHQPDHWANLTLTGIVSPIEKRGGWLPIVIGLIIAIGGGALVFGRQMANNNAA